MSSQDPSTRPESPDIDQMRFIEGAHALPHFRRNDFMTIDKIPKYRDAFGNIGIYLSAYLYDQVDDMEQAYLYGDFYLDFDDEQDPENSQRDAVLAIHVMKQKFMFEVPDELIRIYFSGHKGFHVFVPAEVFGVTPDKNLNDYYKLMATDVSLECRHDTLDLKIYDRRRILRMTNSIHPSTGLYKVPLTYTELCGLTMDEIREKAKKPYLLRGVRPYRVPRAEQAYREYQKLFKDRYAKQFDKHRNSVDKPLDFTPACVQEMLDVGPQKGQRNESAAALTSFFVKRGYSEQETWDALVEWNGGSLSERELKTTMKSIIRTKRNYGCTSLSTLSTCVGKECPLFKADRFQTKGGRP